MTKDPKAAKAPIPSPEIKVEAYWVVQALFHLSGPRSKGEWGPIALHGVTCDARWRNHPHRLRYAMGRFFNGVYAFTNEKTARKCFEHISTQPQDHELRLVMIVETHTLYVGAVGPASRWSNRKTRN